MRPQDTQSNWESEDPRPDIWQRLSRLVFVLVVLAAIPCAFVIIWPQLEKQRQMSAENAVLEIQRDRLLAEKGAKDMRLELIRTNPEYLEAVARDRLGLHKEGEFIFQFERPKPALEGK